MRIKRKTALALCLLLLAAVYPAKLTYAKVSEIYVEYIETETLATDVTYKKIRQVTNDGFRSIYVIEAELGENVGVKAIEPSVFGLRESLSSMTKKSGALGAINGDFFDMLTYAYPFGPIVEDGVLRSVNTTLNDRIDHFAAFYLDFENNPLFAYINPSLTFLNNGEKNIDIQYMNKFTDLKSPAYFDRLAITDTSALDAKEPNLVKLVVDDGLISYISQGGETVQVPENGYVIALDANTANKKLSKFKVGQTALFTVSSSLDYSKIKMSIGGSAMILVNGAPANDSGYIVSKARNPRSAIGVSKDGKTLMLVAIDGRKDSIGADWDELTQIMLDLGAYTALCMDGGGSTEMTIGSAIVSQPSEGTERKIANGLAIFDTAPIGEMNGIKIVPESEIAVKNTDIKFNVYGTDNALHRLPIDHEKVVVVADNGETITYDAAADVYSVPVGDGSLPVTIYANYKDDVNEYYDETVILQTDIITLTPSVKTLALELNETQEIVFTGRNADNQTFPVCGDFATVYPDSLGSFDNGTFTALSGGVGYIEFKLGQTVAYVEVSVEAADELITDFSDSQWIEFQTDSVTATGYQMSNYYPINDEEGNYTGTDKITSLMNYYFMDSTELGSSVYFNFKTPYTLNNLKRLNVAIRGSKSGDSLFARMTDANGVTVDLKLAESLDFDDERFLQANLPSSMVHPVKLNGIVVQYTGLNNNKRYNIEISSIFGGFALSEVPPPHPADSVYYDPKTRANEGNAIDISEITVTAGKGSIGVSDQNCVYSLTLSDLKQWAGLRDFTTDSGIVVLTVDKNPLKNANKLQREMIEHYMKQLFLWGKEVYIVSGSGNNTVSVVGGLRYVSLADGGSIKIYGVDNNGVASSRYAFH